MRIKLSSLALVLGLSLAARPAAAQILTFDDIPDVPNGTVYVPTIYHGYTFGGGGGVSNGQQNSWVTNLGFWQSQFPLSTSSPVSAWANAATPLTLSRAIAFDFTSVWLGASFGFCPQTPNVTVSAYLGGSLVASDSRALTCGTFQQESFNWTNVDEVRFSTPTPLASLTLDDINVSDVASVVPEPATFVLMAAGMLSIGVLARRRRNG